MVKTFFCDNTSVVGTIEATETIADLLQTVADTLGIMNVEPFGIFEANRATGVERWLDPRLHPYKIIAYWGEENLNETFGMTVHKKSEHGHSNEGKKYGGKHSEEEEKDSGYHPLAPSSMYKNTRTFKDTVARYKFVFKLRYRTKAPPSEDIVDLLYAQAVSEVVAGMYRGFVLPPDAVSLAGLQAHVLFGNYTGSVHHAGFLTDRIEEFIPSYMIDDRNRLDWEAAIFREHAKCIGCTEAQAKMLYIEMLYDIPTYGSTWYNVERLDTRGGSNVPFTLAVNMNGLHILARDDKNVVKFIPKDNWMAWSPSDGVLTVKADDTTQEELDRGGDLRALQYKFVTEQSKEIASLMKIYHEMTEDDIYGTGPGRRRKRFNSSRKVSCYLISRMMPGERRANVNNADGIQIGDEVIIDPGTAIEERAIVVEFGSIVFENGVRHAHEIGCAIVPPLREIPLDIDHTGRASHPLASTAVERRRREIEAKERDIDGFMKVGSGGPGGRGMSRGEHDDMMQEERDFNAVPTEKTVNKRTLSKLREFHPYGGSSEPPALMRSTGGDAAAPRPRTVETALPKDWLMGNSVSASHSRPANKDQQLSEMQEQLERRDRENKALKDQIEKSKELLRKFDIDAPGDDPMVEALRQLRMQEKKLRKDKDEVEELRRELEFERDQYRQEHAFLQEDITKLNKKLARIKEEGGSKEDRQLIEKLLNEKTAADRNLRSLRVQVRAKEADDAEYAVGQVGYEYVDATGAPINRKLEKKEIPESLKGAHVTTLTAIKTRGVAVRKATVEDPTTKRQVAGYHVMKAGIFNPEIFPTSHLKSQMPDIPFFSDFIWAPGDRSINLHTGMVKNWTGIPSKLSMHSYTDPPAPSKRFLDTLKTINAADLELDKDAPPYDFAKARGEFTEHLYPYDMQGLYPAYPMLTTTKPEKRRDFSSVHLCEICGEKLSKGLLSSNKHTCMYCNRIICTDDLRQSIVPWEIYKHGNFDTKDVCVHCEEHIKNTIDLPMLPYKDNKELPEGTKIGEFGVDTLKVIGKHLRALNAFQDSIEKIFRHIYIRCPARHFLVDIIPPLYEPLFYKPGARLSMQDIVNIQHGTYVAAGERIVGLFEKHMKSCRFCADAKSARVPVNPKTAHRNLGGSGSGSGHGHDDHGHDSHGDGHGKSRSKKGGHDDHGHDDHGDAHGKVRSKSKGGGGGHDDHDDHGKSKHGSGGSKKGGHDDHAGSGRAKSQSRH